MMTGVLSFWLSHRAELVTLFAQHVVLVAVSPLPSIVAGIRVAAVVGVGTATIAAAIGAGGLGEYIYRGLSMVDTTVILAGAIPAAMLALTVDGMLWWMERRLSARRRIRARRAMV